MKNRNFPDKLFCFYQGTSDDLLFWALFDVLFLTINKNFSAVQISLVFTISYWVSIACQGACFKIIRKLKAGTSIVIGSFLFLFAAIFITFGQSLALVVVGQCLYRIAALFQGMSSAILKKAKSGSKKSEYVRIMSAANIVVSIVSLIASCLVSTLFKINPNFPMYICILFCISSCIMAIILSKYDIEDTKNVKNELLPGKRMPTMEKITITCLAMSVIGNVILMVSGPNLRIFLEQSLSNVFEKNTVVAIYSFVMISTRVAKLLSNTISYIKGNKGGKSKKSFLLVVVLTALISVFGVLASVTFGVIPAILVALGILVRAIVYDPYRVLTSDYILQRLNHDKMVTVLYYDLLLKSLLNAIFSLITTLIISASGLPGVMIMILVLSVVMLFIFRLLTKQFGTTIKTSKYSKWKYEDYDKSSDLNIATTVLIEQYGIVNKNLPTPNKLTEKLKNIEDISTLYKHIKFEGYNKYTYKKLTELYKSGHPCAILAKVNEDDEFKWFPVIFLDDDGGIVYNRNKEDVFIFQFKEVNKICSFIIQ